MPTSFKRGALLPCALLTLFAFLVHGYHPYSEDGGVYLAGVEKLLQPALFPAWTPFVTEHLRFSLFAPLVAGAIRTSHLHLEPFVLALYVASLFATLLAAWKLVARITGQAGARLGAVCLLACWLTLPIAGTSLMLVDPYLTARSLSTPLTLLAIEEALAAGFAPAQSRRRVAWWCVGAALLAACALHPLMGGYGLAAVAVVLCVTSKQQAMRRWGPWVLGAGALGAAGLLCLRAAPESETYRTIAMTRYYWFPFRWEWYEQVGLIAPLLLLLLLRKSLGSAAARALGTAAIVLGCISLAVAVVFCRALMATHLVARMQPLRCYQFVYEVMIVLIGAWLGGRVLKASAWRWCLLLAGFGGLMFFVQRNIYAGSAHLELPGRAPTNPWQQAFVWARESTPVVALFALDAHYITGAGEDAQCFRAMAQRSALPDYSKDGGEASITPVLTEAWAAGQAAQTGLDQASDALRVQRLAPLHVSFVVLKAASPTAWQCPYNNAAVKVCTVPSTP